jgi:hypothetical protein
MHGINKTHTYVPDPLYEKFAQPSVTGMGTLELCEFKKFVYPQKIFRQKRVLYLLSLTQSYF